MLNELSLVVNSLERLGMVAPSRHPRINPMGKNRELFVVSLDSDGNPARIEVLPGETAAKLFRIEHGSAGASFPGFNLPTPLRRFSEAPSAELVTSIKKLLSLCKNKNSSASELGKAIRELFNLSQPQLYTSNQEKQFQRSCSELVEELNQTLPTEVAELKNFKTLIEIVTKSRTTLPALVESLAGLLANSNTDSDRRSLLLFQDVLFGTLDWKKRTVEIGVPDYWEEKAKQDNNANQPVYMDLASPDTAFWRVAHSEMSELINLALFKTQPKAVEGNVADVFFGLDAFGKTSVLQNKFPVGPKVAELGNVKLFSVNTNEVQALQRYRFKGSQSFPISSELVQKMSDALLYLASEDKRGITCRAIPSALPDKRDLLLAYLEGEPEGRAQLAEMFGGEASVFSDRDFEEIAKPVLEMLEGRIAANANLNVRLVAFCRIDKAKMQISLNFQLRVRDVIRAARNWEAGVRNAPEVSIWFYDKTSKQSVFRSHTSPCPLELASVINRVWSADAKNGFTPSYQRAISVNDAYDVFLSDSSLTLQKTEVALGLLVSRMHPALVALGAAKTTQKWTLSDTVRWQSVKAIALMGILLHKIGQYKETFMQESITQVGRLLALADSLHQQYCKHVRKGESPSQLIGNALFNTALDQPVLALARLAERLILPYQAWARTFQSNDPEAGVGLTKYLLGEIAACTADIHPDALPQRMSDADKAKLLLGYLADHPKHQNPKQ